MKCALSFLTRFPLLAVCVPQLSGKPVDFFFFTPIISSKNVSAVRRGLAAVRSLDNSATDRVYVLVRFFLWPGPWCGVFFGTGGGGGISTATLLNYCIHAHHVVWKLVGMAAQQRI